MLDQEAIHQRMTTISGDTFTIVPDPSPDQLARYIVRRTKEQPGTDPQVMILTHNELHALHVVVLAWVRACRRLAHAERNGQEIAHEVCQRLRALRAAARQPHPDLAVIRQGLIQVCVLLPRGASIWFAAGEIWEQVGQDAEALACYRQADQYRHPLADQALRRVQVTQIMQPARQKRA